MSDIAELQVRIAADTQRLQQGISQAGMKGGQGFARTFKRAMGPLLGAAAFAGAVKGVTSLVSASSDLGESVNAVNVMYKQFGKDAPKAVQALSKSAAREMGLSRKEFNDTAVSFGGFINAMGKSGKEATGTLEDLTQRAADFASVNNLEVSAAADKFRAALAGSSEVMMQYGINVSMAAVEQYALEQGMIAAGDKMTEQQKVQARYGLLMQETAQTAGDFGNTQDSLANSLRTLSGSFENAKAMLGQAFLPAVEAAVVQMKNVVGQFEDRFAEVFGNKKVTKALAGVGQAIGDVFAGFSSGIDLDWINAERIADWLNDLADSIPGVVDTVKNDWLPAFTDFVDLAKGLGEGAGSASWTLIESIGSALESLPPEWRDDIVKIGALLAVVSKVKPVGNIFAGLGGLFGKKGILAGTKTMTVTAGVVNVAGGKGGVPAAGTAGGAAAGGAAGRAGKVATLAAAAKVGALGALGAATVATAITAGSVSAIRAIDPEVDRRAREAAKAAIPEKIDAIIEFDSKAKRSDDALVKYLSGLPDIGFGANNLPTLFQDIIAQVENAAANDELDKLTADRIARIAAIAEARNAADLLDDTAALRIADMLAEGHVDEAQRLLDDTANPDKLIGRVANLLAQGHVDEATRLLEATANPDPVFGRIANLLAEGHVDEATRLLDTTANPDPQWGRIANLWAEGHTERAMRLLAETANPKGYGRDADIHAVPKTEAFESAMRYLTETKKYTVDVAVRILSKPNQGPANDYPGGAGGLDFAHQQIRDLAEQYAKENASSGTGKLFGSRRPITKTYAQHGYAIDVDAPVGTPVYAPFSGTLTNQSFVSNGQFYSYGRLATLQSGGHMVRVAHLSQFAQSGQVRAGQVIGYTGNTGKSTGPHAHIEYYRNGVNTSPQTMLYDKGGWLPHGRWALNMSGQPERVLSPAESKALRTLQIGRNSNQRVEAPDLRTLAAAVAGALNGAELELVGADVLSDRVAARIRLADRRA